MDLGMINPVDEGIVLYGATMIFTGIVGTQFWKQESFAYGLKNNDIFLITLAVFLWILSV